MLGIDWIGIGILVPMSPWPVWPWTAEFSGSKVTAGRGDTAQEGLKLNEEDKDQRAPHVSFIVLTELRGVWLLQESTPGALGSSNPSPPPRRAAQPL